MSINKWRVYCIDEASFVEGFLPSGSTCTTCFNNTTHSVNNSSISITETVTPNTVLISTQNPGETSGYYRRERKKMTIAAGPDVITTQIISFKYPVGMLAFNVDIATANEGDVFDALVAPINFSPVGVLTANASAGACALTVNSGALAYLKIGFNLVLFSSSNVKEEAQEIIAINTTNNTITLESGITGNYVTGNYISFFITRCKNYHMNCSESITMGNFLRSSLFGTTLQAQLRYTNKSNIEKTFVYGIDYLF
jgi:hypothetical protein